MYTHTILKNCHLFDRESVLSFQHPWNQTQVVIFEGKCLWPLSHLTSLSRYFYILIIYRVETLWAFPCPLFYVHWCCSCSYLGRVVEPTPTGWYFYKTTSVPKVQGTLWKKGQKDCRSQRIGEFFVRLCLLVIQKLHSFDIFRKSSHCFHAGVLEVRLSEETSNNCFCQQWHLRLQ